MFASLHPIFDNIQNLSYKKWVELFDQQKRPDEEHFKSNSINGSSNKYETRIHNEIQWESDNFLQTSSSNASNNSTLSITNEIAKTQISMRKHLPLSKTTSLPQDSVKLMLNDKPLSNLFFYIKLY